MGRSLTLPKGWEGWAVHYRGETDFPMGHGEKITVHEWTITRPGEVVTVFRRISSPKNRLLTGWECKRVAMPGHDAFRESLAEALTAMDYRHFLCGHKVARAEQPRGGCPVCDPAN
jgi:hypothetical protein